MGIENYNTTPGNNGSVLATGSLLEGQAPSTLNDAIRQALADLRNFYNDPQWIEYGIGNGSTTYTRVNSTTVTISANLIDVYHVGRRVKIVDGTGTTIYGTITTVSFNSPNTTIVMSFDNSASIGSGTITSFKIGAISSVNTSSPTNVNTGGIIMWSTANLPDGWLLADGSFVSKTTYAGLWNAIGSTYGTPSASQFYLPNLKDKFVIGKGSTYSTLGGTGGSATMTPAGSVSAPTFSGSSSSVSGSVSISGTSGSHTLTEAQIPSHHHKILANTNVSNVNMSTTSSIAKASAGGFGNNDYTLSHTTTAPTLAQTSSVGGNSGHTHSFSASASLSGGTTTASGSVSAPNFTGNSASIINPYIAMSYIIKT
tara:strand:+ start:554 stop:1663 length:1110 start_codon:yes stop_codon:yes gene_type:complete